VLIAFPSSAGQQLSYRILQGFVLALQQKTLAAGWHARGRFV